MKRFTGYSVPIALALLFQFCNESENEPLVRGKVQFTVTSTVQHNVRGRTSELPAGAYLLISVTGEESLNRHRIELLQYGEHTVSEPIELAPGHYQLTEFMVMSQNGEVLYVTPVAGSRLAQTVSHPLPIAFSISHHEVANLDVEAVSIEGSNPEDAGYVSFELDIVHLYALHIAVSRITDDGVEATAAEAFVASDNDTLSSHVLDAGVNEIFLKHDPDDTLALIIGKPGYARHIREFTYNQLRQELNGEPLMVTLEPALTMVAYIPYVTAGQNNFRMPYLDGAPGNEIILTVDWGDGTSEQFSNMNRDPEFGHFYSEPGDYFISITGELEEITKFSSSYEDAMFNGLNTEHLPELTALEIGVTRVPETIDLTHHAKLQSVRLPWVYELKHLYLPEDHFIIELNVQWVNSINIDDVIEKLYAGVEKNNLQGGTFDFLKFGEDEDKPIGPPSEASREKLNRLENVYRWTIIPGKY